MKRVLVVFLMPIFTILLFAANEDWANRSRYADANARLEKSPDVVFMGNSITDFWVKIDSAFWTEHPGFAGRGISGQTTSRMLARFDADVVALKPKVVVILAGINDIAQNDGPISIDDIANNIKEMCRKAKDNGITPVVCSVLPCAYLSWIPHIKPAKKVKKLNAILRRYASDEGLVYVDYYPAMATENGAMRSEYTKDGCHPTLAGYLVMDAIITPILCEMGIK